MKDRAALVAVLSVGIILLAGCGSSTKEMQLVPTTGKVSYADETPASGLKLVFLPDENNLIELEAIPAADGSFTIKSIGGKVGAMTGKYRVAFEILNSEDSKTKASEARKKIPKKLQSVDSTNYLVNIVAGTEVVIKLQKTVVR